MTDDTPPNQALHAGVLLETARSELEAAHRAALAADAGGLRRGIELALTALAQLDPGASDGPDIASVQASLQAAQTDLEAGQLVEMEKLLEEARAALAKV